jgi:hypothetical protein
LKKVFAVDIQTLQPENHQSFFLRVDQRVQKPFKKLLSLACNRVPGREKSPREPASMEWHYVRFSTSATTLGSVL